VSHHSPAHASGDTLTVMSLRALPFAAVLIACTGGGGSISGDYQSTQDRPPHSNEAVASTTETKTASNENLKRTVEGATNTGGTGSPSAAGFNCLGTYECAATANGKSSGKKQKLVLPACNTSEGGFQSDGTFTKDGKVVATWQPTGSGFILNQSVTSKNTTVTVTLDCTRVSSSTTPIEDDDDDDDDDVATTQ
jgi:hypothetical protein